MAYLKELEKAKTVIESAKKSDTPLIVYDTETEGLSTKNHRIIQISAKKIDPESLKHIDDLCIYINPERPLDKKITELTGITDELLGTCRTESEVFQEIYDFFGDHPVVIAYNTAFDNRFLTALYERNGIKLSFADPDDPAFQRTVDVLAMVREQLHAPTEVKDHKLATITEHLGADAGITFHNAMDDVTACYRVFLSLYDKDSIPVKKEPVKISGVSFYLGFRGHNRIYVYTPGGSLYYDGKDKVWDSKDLDMKSIDAGSVSEQLRARYEAADDEELFRKCYQMHCDKMQSYVGWKKTFPARSDADAFIKKMTGKHFDVSVSETDDGYIVTLQAFFKSRTGKVYAA